jgi:hypothetical protein
MAADIDILKQEPLELKNGRISVIEKEKIVTFADSVKSTSTKSSAKLVDTTRESSTSRFANHVKSPVPMVPNLNPDRGILNQPVLSVKKAAQSETTVEVNEQL